ncbi:MAG: nucleotidyltransferase family protein [Gammaproteobacteria bacterium]|nr:nucleotidyltransferase family protein [Gammaproteobacteria bacterium]
MNAMILGAGRGERMRPLTDQVPKPLVAVRGKPLIEHLIEALVRGGTTDIVINIAYRGDQIRQRLGCGRRFGARLRYSDEGAVGLETGGGIVRAMPLLDSDPFLVVNGDIYTDYPFTVLPAAIAGLAHLVLVDNPPEHPDGDFGLRGSHVVHEAPRLTFAGIGLYRKSLFAHPPGERFALGPLLRETIDKGLVTGEHYRGDWTDVGTPQRLAALNAGA